MTEQSPPTLCEYLETNALLCPHSTEPCERACSGCLASLLTSVPRQVAILEESKARVEERLNVAHVIVHTLDFGETTYTANLMVPADKPLMWTVPVLPEGKRMSFTSEEVAQQICDAINKELPKHGAGPNVVGVTLELARLLTDQEASALGKHLSFAPDRFPGVSPMVVYRRLAIWNEPFVRLATVSEPVRSQSKFRPFGRSRAETQNKFINELFLSTALMGTSQLPRDLQKQLQELTSHSSTP